MPRPSPRPVSPTHWLVLVRLTTVEVLVPVSAPERPVRTVLTTGTLLPLRSTRPAALPAREVA